MDLSKFTKAASRAVKNFNYFFRGKVTMWADPQKLFEDSETTPELVWHRYVIATHNKEDHLRVLKYLAAGNLKEHKELIPNPLIDDLTTSISWKAASRHADQELSHYKVLALCNVVNARPEFITETSFKNFDDTLRATENAEDRKDLMLLLTTFAFKRPGQLKPSFVDHMGELARSDRDVDVRFAAKRIHRFALGNAYTAFRETASLPAPKPKPQLLAPRIPSP
jgi:hypothetical protein